MISSAQDRQDRFLAGQVREGSGGFRREGAAGEDRARAAPAQSTVGEDEPKDDDGIPEIGGGVDDDGPEAKRQRLGSEVTVGEAQRVVEETRIIVGKESANRHLECSMGGCRVRGGPEFCRG